MQKPMLGHVDPDLHAILGEVVRLLATCFERSDGLTVALSGTGTMGIETGVVNLVEPGEKIIIGAAGYFGFRLQEIARRRGAEVIAVNDDWGKAVSNDRLLSVLAEHPDARMLAVIHAETSTGVLHPLEELAAGMAGSETLLMADCVTSFGAVELRAAVRGASTTAARARRRAWPRRRAWRRSPSPRGPWSGSASGRPTSATTSTCR